MGRVAFDLFFDRNAEEAVRYYADLFDLPVPEMMRYTDIPPEPGWEPVETDHHLIMYADLHYMDAVFMFHDMSADDKFKPGNNVAPCLIFDTLAEAERIYEHLRRDGQVVVPLTKTFFSEGYAQVRDRFGIIWALNVDADGLPPNISRGLSGSSAADPAISGHEPSKSEDAVITPES